MRVGFTRDRGGIMNVYADAQERGTVHACRRIKTLNPRGLGSYRGWEGFECAMPYDPTWRPI